MMIMMALADLLSFIRLILAHIPLEHWLVVGIVSLALTVILIIQKKHSMYATICLGIAVFFVLVLLDTAVVNRLNSIAHPEICFSLSAEYHRLIHGGTVRWTEMLANVAVFVPFGFFLSEFLSTTKRFSTWHQIGRVALAAFVLSLCIESLQLIFRLGVFEITDLVLNTLGGFVGALMSAGVRKVVGEKRHWH